MIDFPHDVQALQRKRRSITRELSGQSGLTPLKLAILGGSTTHEFAPWVELFLLERGIRAEIHQSEYNMYFEDTVVDPSDLVTFNPNIVYLHLSTINIQQTGLTVTVTEAEFESAVRSRMDHLRTVWDAVWTSLSCQIIQNTFEPPTLRPLGHLDASSFGGTTHFIGRLNQELAREARTNPRLLLHDAASLPATAGIANWFSHDRWCAYKMPTSAEADIVQAYSLAAQIAAAVGRSRKVLVLDLDNTLWGGVIGDDGVDRIVLGRETPRAEAYTAFQEYCKRLKERGVVLAVCSKNEDAVARSGFTHPDAVLKLDDFAAFRANWDPKPDNIRSMAEELNLGLDSFVFVDDNPAERMLVAAQLPMVAVPNVGADIGQYARILDAARYFEPIGVSKEDVERTALYAQNAERQALVGKFENYGAYLDSLQMTGEIDGFTPMYLERITQLTNKSNQFNLTTRRYTKAEMEDVAADEQFLTLYGRLADVFGDNGLVSVVIGRRDNCTVHVDLWLMSCRVLKRGMEDAMLDALVSRARDAGALTIVGTYLPTSKNGMVKNFYQTMGFERVSLHDDGRSEWTLDLTQYATRNHHIRVTTSVRHS